MADKRINALANTASSTASDDFIAVDGTTNGTRKLNAFSPTFGGNATVTGNLTVSGTTIRSSNTISVDSGNTSFRYDIYRDGAGTYQLGHLVAYGSQTGFGGFTWANLDVGKLWEISNQGNGVLTGTLKVNSTTASTTTSSGALVVGNGTSGGLGVGGAIVAGGTITSTASTDSGLLQLNLVNSSTGTSASSLFRFNAGTRTATLQAYNDTHATLAGQLRVGTSNGDIVVIPSGVTATTFGSSTVTVNHSTASTSTSSGALVVSGGVGVAGAVFTGGYVHPGGDSNFYIRTTGSSNGLIRANFLSADVASAFLVRNDTGTTEYVRVDSTGLIAAIPATAPSLTVNGTMTFERTSNTSLKISVRGTDGTTRSVSLTLA